MKDTYYFSHDSNARNDEKILMLRAEHGWEGYGIYWLLIEMMFESTDTCLYHSKTKGIAVANNIDITLLQSVITTCIEEELFISNNDKFFSQSLDRRKQNMLNLRKKKSEAGKKGMASRWESNNTDITQLKQSNNTDITKHNKGKERIVKDSIVKESKKDKEPKGSMSIANTNDLQSILDYWNQHSKLKDITQITPKRKKFLEVRIKENGIDSIYTTIDNCGLSTFMRGDNNKNWIASFDWVFGNPNNFIKVLEGNYVQDKDSKGNDDLSRRAKRLEERFGHHEQ